MSKTIKSLIAFSTLAGMMFSAYLYVENRYALANDLKKIERRLDYKILSDHIQSTQERIWQIEDRYSDKQMPRTVNEEHRILLDDKEKLKEKLDQLQKTGD